MDLTIPDEERTAPPADRVQTATQRIDQLARTTAEYSRLRREAVQEMLDGGMTKSQVAREVRLDPSRITRIVGTGTPPERALLSPDGEPVTVALGSKTSSVNGNPSDMISRDAAEAYDTLRSTLDGYGLPCSREVVPAPGLVDLNRPNLIVMGSPKVLPMIGQLLASDPNLEFAEDDSGRHLVDWTTGETHRSPQDSGKPSDYAYIGRLPRPDGQGTFLYLAGIHAAGTHGAVRWLVENLPDLYQEVRNRSFSLLVKADYDADDRERGIISTDALTQIHVR